MTAAQRADIEAIINAIGEISKTEALNAIDQIIAEDGNQGATEVSAAAMEKKE